MPPDFPLDPTTTADVWIAETGVIHTAKHPTSPHYCQAPQARDYGVGSIYCCPECHRISFCRNYYGWDKSFNRWKLETDKERRKRWKRGVIYKGELR